MLTEEIVMLGKNAGMFSYMENLLVKKSLNIRIFLEETKNVSF